MTETDGRVRRALEGDSDALRSRVLPLDDIEILSRAKGGDGRTVVAYAASFGKRTEIHDQDGHYTEENHPESFHKTTAERGLRFGVFYHHGRTLHGTPSERGSVPLGRPVLVKPDGNGLLTHTAYNRTPLADDVLESIRNGDPMGMSFTGAYLQSDPPKAPYYSRSDGSLQHVVRKEIALIEYGPTPMPAYDDAEILGVRAAQARQEARDAAERATGPESYERHPGENVQCPACGKYNEPDAVWCDQCGAKLPESAFPNGHQPYEREPGETVQCPDCGRFNEPDASFCFAAETEVITRDGIARIGDLAGTRQMVLTQREPAGKFRALEAASGHWVEAPVESFGEQRLLSVTLKRYGQRKVIRATPEHIWFASASGRWADGRTEVRAVTTADMKPGMTLASLMAQPITGTGTSPSPFGVAAGFTFGDGHRRQVRGGGSEATLWGEKDQALLPFFAGCRTFPAKNGNGTLGTRVTGMPGSWKDYPALTEGTSYLLGWLAGYVAADGTVGPNGRVLLHSARREDLEFAAVVANRLGIAAYPIVTYDRTGLGQDEPSAMYRLAFVTRTVPPDLLVLPPHRSRFAEQAAAERRRGTPVHWTVEKVEDLGEAEEVFCAVVPDTHTFALADYIWVHNCDQCGHALPPTAYEGIPAVPGGTTAFDAAGAASTNGRAADTWTGTDGARAMSTARHEPISGSHSHSHPAYGSQGGDATHTHAHSHDGDASHAHSHAADDSGDGDGGSSQDDGGDMGSDAGTGSRSDDPVTVLCEHFGWQPEAAQALSEHERALLLASIARGHHERAGVDNSPWDASKAWANGAASDDPAAFYNGICAGTKAGDPKTQAAHALPYKYHPGDPPNADGVRNALGRLPQTEGLTNAAEAKATLQKAMKQVNPDYEPGEGDSSSGSTSGRSDTTPAADGTGAGEPAPEAQRSAAQTPPAATATTDSTGPHEHPAATAQPTVEPQQHSTASPTSSERTNVVETMTIEQRITRRGEIDARILEISGEHGERALPPEVQAEWDTLTTEADEHERAIGEHERAVAARRARVRSIVARQRPGSGETIDPQATGYTAPNGDGDGTGAGERSRTPGLLPGRTDDSIWDLDAVRKRANSLEEATGMYRDNARRAIERGAFPGSDNRERAQSTVERLLASVDDEAGTLARRILATGSPLYMRAWGKAVARLSVAGLSEEEGRALALGTGSEGGYAVPYQLDPTVLLTSNGAINPLRQISRTQQITGKEYDLVTSSGVTVTRSAEGSAVGDNTPALGQPTIKAERVTGFIPFSVEIEQDWQALQSEMMMLLADAKDVEESSSFTNGDGTGTNAGGIIGTLGTASQITGTGGTATLAAGDLYAAEDAMAPRFRPEASWMASKTTFNAYRQLFTQTASAAGDEWVRPTMGTPAQLLGYPAYEDSDMTAVHTSGSKVIVLGDFGRGMLIVDRLGMSTELVPHLFDQATARPTASRGLLSIWRNNCMVLIPQAFRLVVVL